MSDWQFVQMLIGSLFGLSLFVKMWRHSMSVFIMLSCGTITLFIYDFMPNISVLCFSISAIYVTIRGAMKPKGERVWI
ncbi:hypothetical protein PGH07_07740 [Sulfurovum sp. zt1-1]|uniref:Nicotinamide riboside transporter PnuC n=1 Tax=Sulfurovum zhangzhouensis TaxID=3019067 RepID=A0ABT7QZ57_9BACT|nr:hypothetical protein [Sulfurovum zhangzhouensis]MDM5272068.1 hypothetical protein [Sulfurovum zhangzhouensis]